jgi:hypothetical protein
MLFKTQHYIISHVAETSECELHDPCAYRFDMLSYQAYVEQCFLTRVQPSVVWLFPAFLALPRDIQSYDAKHHNSFNLVCLHGSNQQ